MSITDFLAGKRVLEEVESPINGKIEVIKDLTWGTHIKVDNLTQSGGILEKIWKSTIKKIRNSKPEIRSCLILGLGGGSLGKLIRKQWPEAKITGVDIDPLFIELGRKYLKLDEYDVNVVVGDAYDYLKKHRSPVTDHRPQTHNLICVDIYTGDDYPEKFEKARFIELVKRNLDEDGLAVFNRLYHDDKRNLAVKFGNRLEKHFKNVDWVYPEANVMFICRDAKMRK